MRIMFVMAKMSGGGAENVAARIASALSAEHEVEVVCLHYDPKPPYALDDRVAKTLLDARPYLWRRLLFWRKGSFKGRFSLLESLRAEKRRFQPDVSISFLEMGNYYNVASGLGELTVACVRNSYSMKFRTLPNGSMETEQAQFVCEHADKLLCISEYVRHDQIQNYHARPESTQVIYNPVDADDLSARAAAEMDREDRTWLDEGGTVVLAVGRLVVQKGHWHLIRAFRRVVEAVPDARLMIVGEGPLHSALQELVCDCGMENHVRFAGHKANPYPYYTAADVFVFPSLFEGLGNSLLEAMAFGLPIISSDCPGGPRELIAPGSDPLAFCDETFYAEYGVLVPACGDALTVQTDRFSAECDEPADALRERCLADAIIDVAGNAELRERLSRMSVKRSRDFALESIMSQWDDVLGI